MTISNTTQKKEPYKQVFLFFTQRTHHAEITSTENKQQHYFPYINIQLSIFYFVKQQTKVQL